MVQLVTTLAVTGVGPQDNVTLSPGTVWAVALMGGQGVSAHSVRYRLPIFVLMLKY